MVLLMTLIVFDVRDFLHPQPTVQDCWRCNPEYAPVSVITGHMLIILHCHAKSELIDCLIRRVETALYVRTISPNVGARFIAPFCANVGGLGQ
jgi:hypothetical protein